MNRIRGLQLMHIKTITTRQTFIEAIQLQGIVQVKEYKFLKIPTYIFLGRNRNQTLLALYEKIWELTEMFIET